MADERDSNDGDEVKLSASTLAALREFYAERDRYDVTQAAMDTGASTLAVLQEFSAERDCYGVTQAAMDTGAMQQCSDTSHVIMPAEDWVTAGI